MADYPETCFARFTKNNCGSTVRNWPGGAFTYV